MTPLLLPSGSEIAASHCEMVSPSFSLRRASARSSTLPENVQLVDRVPDNIFLGAAGHGQKALVHADKAQVGDSADQGWSWIGIERALEAVLCLVPLRLVFDNKNQIVWGLIRIRDHDAADGMYPTHLRACARRNLHHHVPCLLAGNHPFDRMLPGFTGWLFLYVSRNRRRYSSMLAPSSSCSSTPCIRSAASFAQRMV